VPVKEFELDSVGTVHVYKRKGAKTLRLSIASDGKVKVTVPFWATYNAGLEFADSKKSWIQLNRPDRPGLLGHGQHIGKAHRLVFDHTESGELRTRIAGSEIRIGRPKGMMITHPDVQQAAHKASIRALRTQAQKLLPVRIKQLADKYGFEYSSVQVKQLTGRWGSCDTHKRITLNLFLMQLPWHLIDYVLIHELTHTKHLNHSADFWAEFMRHEPRAKLYRKEIRTHKPILVAGEAKPAMA
jgi:predicted metal-dependent hydrolase